jgi:hypothetical protein
MQFFAAGVALIGDLQKRPEQMALAAGGALPA